MICTLVMALRVLLADESSTIKKALQLALGDLGVEVKSVPSGLDVVSVALDFHPEIIFADILLTKRNGYDVCAEIKAHASLKNIPVILMWSSFMEFDEKLAQKSGYNGRLEKPFDTEALRSIVHRFVKKTNVHPLKGLLEFPKLPDFDESETALRQKNHLQEIKSIDDVEEDFKPIHLNAHLNSHQNSHHNANLTTDHKNLVLDPLESAVDLNPSGHSNHIHIETENFGEFEEVILVTGDHDESPMAKNKSELNSKINSQIKTYLENSPVALNKAQKAADFGHSQNQSRFDEQIMREEVRLMAEKICWQIIPDIAEKIVREEIKKLLTDIEKNT